MRFRNLTIAVAIPVLAVTALAGCSADGTTGSGGATGGGAAQTLSLAAQTDNNSFDTAKLDVANNIQYWQPIYDTLVKLTPAGDPQPNLATEWTYTADRKALTLKLRTGVTFTDGKPFDAEAVKANLEHFAKGGGPSTYMLQDFQDAKVVDPSTVTIDLKQASPAFVGYLGQPAGAMASPAALTSGQIESQPIGSGPYVLDPSTTRGSRYVYARNPGYWNAKAYPFNQVVITPMNDNTPRLNALKTGQVNGAFLAQTSAKEAQASGLKLVTEPVDFLGINIADRDGKLVPALKDVKVRRAISMAVDRAGVSKALYQDLAEPTAQLFNKQSSAYVPALDQADAFDVNAAKQLMSEAGYAGGFEVTMPTTSQLPSLDPIVDAGLKAIGITVHRDALPRDQYKVATQSGKYAMYSLPQAVGDPWRDIQKYLLPKGPSNPLHSENPELTALVDKVRTATSDDARAAAYQDVNRWVVDNAWFAVWTRPLTVYGTTTDVTTTMQFGNTVPYLSSYKPATAG